MPVRLDAGRAEALVAAARAFSEASLDLETTLETIARQLCTLLADACQITLLSDDGQWLQPVALHHVDPEGFRLLGEILRHARQPASEGVSARVLATGEALLLPRVDQQARRAGLTPVYGPYLDRFTIHSLLLVPLRARGRALGTLGVTRLTPHQPYTDQDREFLQELADLASLAIENARLVAQQREAEARYQSLFEGV